jgi:dihydroflavonol-4-reductase
MKYLVTGATGLLGNNVVRQLLAAGHEVRVLARSTSDPRPFEGLAVQRAGGDIRDAEAVAAACRDVQVIIHAAGHVHIGWTQHDLHQRINVEGARNIAAAARLAGAKLVHVSTINALGLGHLSQPADEETALPGIIECPYVTTKRQAELIVLDEVARGLAAVIVNPSLMLGPWDWKPSSGKMVLAVARFAPFAPLGAANFCDVRDVAAGVIAAAEKAPPGRRYILGGHNLTYWDAWRQMARLAGKRGPFLPMGPLIRAIGAPALNLHTWVTGREGDANSAAMALGCQQHCFSSRRAEQELGYRVRPLAETLTDTWAWFRENGYV